MVVQLSRLAASDENVGRGRHHCHPDYACDGQWDKHDKTNRVVRPTHDGAAVVTQDNVTAVAESFDDLRVIGDTS
jgi:hypothetical protein